MDFVRTRTSFWSIYEWYKLLWPAFLLLLYQQKLCSVMVWKKKYGNRHHFEKTWNMETPSKTSWKAPKNLIRLRWNLFGSKDYHLYIGCKPQFSFCVTQSHTTKQSTHNQWWQKKACWINELSNSKMSYTRSICQC